MASKKLPRGTPEFEMFGEFYNLVQEFYEVEDTDEYWDGLIYKSGKLIDKYGRYSLARYLCSGFADYQGHKLNERRKNDGR